MKAIGICGSPRANGNTELLLKRCLGRLEESGIETRLMLLREKKVLPCTACGFCREHKDGTCANKADDFAEVFSAMTEADIIVVGSPVYFGSATPEMMALLDRAGYVSRHSGNLFSRKIGGPIVVARRAGQNFTYAQLLFWFMIMDMVVPGSSYWNIAFGLQPGTVESDEEAFSTIDRFAENLAWLGERVVA